MDTLISKLIYLARSPSSTGPSESQRSALVLCWAVLARQHGKNQRISAGACTVTPRTRSWRICSFAFRAAPTTAQSAPHRFPRSEQREAVGRLIPQRDRFKGGAGSKYQVRHPFPPTIGFSDKPNRPMPTTQAAQHNRPDSHHRRHAAVFRGFVAEARPQA